MGETAVEVRDGEVLINGQKRVLLGFRTGSAPLLEGWTAELADQLDLWEEMGVNAFHLWLQGTSGGYVRLFDDEGSIGSCTEEVLVRAGYGIDEEAAVAGRTSGREVIARSRALVEEADRRGMVVFVGFFYSPAVARWGPKREELVVAAGRAAERFGEYTNVILDVWNEPHLERKHQGLEDLKSYLWASKEAAPGCPVGTGSVKREMNPPLAGLKEVDLVMTDAGRDLQSSVRTFEDLKGFGKPVVNVETFGGRGNAYLDAPRNQVAAPAGYCLDFEDWRRVFGAWREEDYVDGTGRRCAGRRAYEQLIDYAAQDDAGQYHVLVHAGGWFQGASRVERPDQVGDWEDEGLWTNTFHPGYGSGRGTVQEPGIRWLLERFRQVRGVLG